MSTGVCRNCEHQNLRYTDYPCRKCIKNPDPKHIQEGSFDMWEQWDPYNTSFSSASSWRKINE